MKRQALTHTLEKVAMFKLFKNLAKHPIIRDAKLMATGAGTVGAAWLGDKQYRAMKRLYSDELLKQQAPQLTEEQFVDNDKLKGQ